ncbi:MAG: ATP-binding protein [Candidatus Cloacimonetes bacterium]|nr:ATP-binding protein [Candidatus Cloacimonadota bacterium]MCF7869347.1 ATP-binding protein [Candidatus Cloacimonadota bacterium]MCF7884742.1 ATP-binding protein [Candidatus Cloacimonadota bacterium]
MIKRQMQDLLKEMMNSFPVVTVTGPRQSGKTTLVRQTYPEMDYISLEDLDNRDYAEKDPRDFLARFSHSVIIDEIQKVPSLLSYIQTIVESEQRNGRFILTGSNQFEYLSSIAQSLAGRTGILKLLPFSYSEIYKKKYIPQNEVIYKGFYPRIFDQNIRPELFLSSYLETYVEKDIRSITKVKDLMQFYRFLQLCAGRTGQILNFSSIGNELGINNKTVKEWVSIAVASYILFLLPPFYKNYNKRIRKSPKLYFLDVGLASHLIGIQNSDQLKTHPLKGELFETFIVIEFLKNRYNQGKRSNLYYFRDNNGNEVDLIIDSGLRPIPIEIKSAQTLNTEFFKGLKYFGNLENNLRQTILVMGTDIKQKRNEFSVYGYPLIDELFSQLTKD